MPFVQYIGSPAQEAPTVAEAPEAAKAPVAAERHADARGDRVFSEPATASAGGKGDRLVAHSRSLDSQQMAAFARTLKFAKAAQAAVSPQASDSTVRDAITADREDKFASLDIKRAPAPEASEAIDAAAAMKADILSDLPHPTVRPEVQLASLSPAETANGGEALARRFEDGIPTPTARPQAPQRAAAPAETAPAATALAPEVEEKENLAARVPPAPLPKARPVRVAPATSASPNAASGPRASTALAYAPPSGATDDSGGGLLNGLGKLFSGNGGGHSGLPGAGSGVAVYDISAATVYMPNGDKLEAHSGLGHMKDNPRFVDRKSKGPTPPNVYNLVMRESRFHGVEAVRLLPADGKKKFGRDGLLAHTYMYKGGGPISQSNGCVVFKDYKRFLAAFKRGRVEKMIVVPNMSKLPVYMAAL